MAFWFILFTIGAYFVHLMGLNFHAIPPESVLLNDAYLLNSLLAITIIVIIYWLRKKYYSQIGFLFLGGSMLKFLCFFLWFSPVFNADGELSRAEFIGFFIPYLLSLIFETLAVSRLLKFDPDADS